MYPFERLLHELKKDVKNKARVEGSIANAYLVREASIFCSHYFEPSVHTRNRKVPRNDDGGAEDDDEEKLAIFTYPGRPYGKLKSRRLNDQEFDAAHSYILVNEEKVQPYLNEYETMLKELIPDISEQDLAAEVDKSFASWFENYVLLQKKRWGHDPTHHELFLYTHTKNHDGETFLVDKAKKIHDDFKERCEQLEAIGEEIDDNQLFYDTVGGHDRKKRLYGFGSYGKSIGYSKGSSETYHSSDNNIDKETKEEIEKLKELVETQHEQYEDIHQKYEDVQKKYEDAQQKNVDVQEKFEQQLAQAMNVINSLSEHVKTFINQ
ncbi:hypothetical protein L2E82_39523 [Cichorium intybus]|uniref:Uncharacterized protein n=1 Tax=Cichorium intybus TaxID=13427 RepID=A0ACB9AHX9_CICIN|nr:hypothetical protein L2E82_39523 [Cichorium intybus]